MNCIYIINITEDDVSLSETKYKYGKTKDLKRRLQQHNSHFGSELIYHREFDSSRFCDTVESAIRKLVNMCGENIIYSCKKYGCEEIHREIIETFEIDKYIEFIETISDEYEADENDLICSFVNKLYKKNLKLKKKLEIEKKNYDDSMQTIKYKSDERNEMVKTILDAHKNNLEQLNKEKEISSNLLKMNEIYLKEMNKQKTIISNLNDLLSSMIELKK